MIIATLWPERYNTYAAVPTPGADDQHARERQVLDLAAVIHIDPEFSPAEQDRARAAAARDRRLAVALESTAYGLTQTLAAAPQLVARWQNAKTASPYAWAVLTTALDTARLGARAPLSAEFLRAAAPGYCTSAQQAEAPDDWFERALAYATGKLHGAAAALAPTGTSMGQIAGYIAADYLLQHASQERRYARLPASTWDAVLSYIHDPDDTARLAHSARRRLLYRYAIPLYRRTDADDHNAARRLVELLARRGDLDGATLVLRARIDAGDYAARWLAARLTERGDLDKATLILRAGADAGDLVAAIELTGLLARRGDLAGLRARADAGDHYAARRLAGLLARRGDLAGATQTLRSLADAGDRDAARWLAELLAERGDLDGATQVLQVLRAQANAGDRLAAWRLAELLARRGDVDGPRGRADADDRWAASRLAEHGRMNGLRPLADDHDHPAASRLAGLLAERGDLAGLRGRADAGGPWAASRLAGLLAERGDLDGAAQILRPLADRGDHPAASRLAGLLAGRGDLAGLRGRADAGDPWAARRLAELLARRGDVDGLRGRADAGDGYAASWLAGLLAERGDLAGLRGLADAGDEDAARRLAELLAQQGRREEAERLRRFGLNPDGSIACE